MPSALSAHLFAKYQMIHSRQVMDHLEILDSDASSDLELASPSWSDEPAFKKRCVASPDGLYISPSVPPQTTPRAAGIVVAALPPSPVVNPALLATQWQLHLVAFVNEWASSLEVAHPALYGLPRELPLLTVVLYRRYLLATAATAGPSAAASVGPCLHDGSALAACLWLALKHHGTRAALPGSSFMARITGVPTTLLLAQELRVLVAIEFRVHAVAMECGVLPPPPLQARLLTACSPAA